MTNTQREENLEKVISVELHKNCEDVKAWRTNAERISGVLEVEDLTDRWFVFRIDVEQYDSIMKQFMNDALVEGLCAYRRPRNLFRC